PGEGEAAAAAGAVSATGLSLTSVLFLRDPPARHANIVRRNAASLRGIHAPSHAHAGHQRHAAAGKCAGRSPERTERRNVLLHLGPAGQVQDAAGNPGKQIDWRNSAAAHSITPAEA